MSLHSINVTDNLPWLSFYVKLAFELEGHTGNIVVIYYNLVGTKFISQQS
jgi:hypothetical protein